MRREILEQLNYSAAVAWLREDVRDDFYPDPIDFQDLSAKREDYLARIARQIAFYDKFASVELSIPKSSLLRRTAIYLRPRARLVFLALLHALRPLLVKGMHRNNYSYRLPLDGNPDSYPFSALIGVAQWKTFDNDFRLECLEPASSAIVVTDLSEYFDHIKLDYMSDVLASLLHPADRARGSVLIEELEEFCERQTSTLGLGLPQGV